jgi:type VI secretion system protein ImpA
MNIIDIDTLLKEVSPDSPSGDDLGYDPKFVEMEEAARGKPEQQFGETMVAAEEPDWGHVRTLALDLLGSSKDLRVAGYLMRALTHTDGLQGLCDGLALVERLIEQYWDSMHPQLDPADDYDPTMRVNILVSLCDPETVLHSVRMAPLVTSPALGRFSLRDIQIAAGQLSLPPDTSAPSTGMSTIEAAFMDGELGDLQGTAAVIRKSIEHVNAIEAFVTEKVGTGHAASLEALTQVLREAGNVVNDHVARRGVTGPEEVLPEAGPEEAARPAEEAPGGPFMGQIRSPGDVILALDKISEYYQRHEPSSPVPLLVQRAKRLVSKGFMEILRDVAPDGVSQAEKVTGLQSK